MTRDIIFKQSADLESLHLMHSQYSRFFMHELHEHPIRMENLLSFSMEFPTFKATHPQFSPERFLGVLDLPSVQSVRLTNYPRCVDTVLKTLVLRSHSSLKRLEFSSTFDNLASGDLTSILMLTPAAHLSRNFTVLCEPLRPHNKQHSAHLCSVA